MTTAPPLPLLVCENVTGVDWKTHAVQFEISYKQLISVIIFEYKKKINFREYDSVGGRPYALNTPLVSSAKLNRRRRRRVCLWGE